LSDLEQAVIENSSETAVTNESNLIKPDLCLYNMVLPLSQCLSSYIASFHAAQASGILHRAFLIYRVQVILIIVCVSILPGVFKRLFSLT
jgi:hypothetical protein